MLFISIIESLSHSIIYTDEVIEMSTAASENGNDPEYYGHAVTAPYPGDEELTEQ